MEMQDIRKLNKDELVEKLKDTRKDHMDLRFKKSSMQLTDTSQIKKTKKIIKLKIQEF